MSVADRRHEVWTDVGVDFLQWRMLPQVSIKEVLLSTDNRKDIEDIDARYTKGMRFTYVTGMIEVTAGPAEGEGGERAEGGVGRIPSFATKRADHTDRPILIGAERSRKAHSGNEPICTEAQLREVNASGQVPDPQLQVRRPVRPCSG